MYRSQLRIVRNSFRPVFLNPVELLVAFRSSRLNAASLQSLSRAYTVPPPAGEAAPNQKAKRADNTVMYTTLGLVAAASAYYYLRNTDDAQELKDKAKAEQNHMKSKSAELVDTAKVRAEDVKQQGKAKWDQVKVCCISRFKIVIHPVRQTGSKERLGSAEREAKEAGGGFVADLETKYDSVKGSAKENLTRARDSTENLYKEARSLSKQEVDEAKKKVDQAKNGWSSWFNWGKSKADDIESEAERSAEHLRSKGAQSVANSGENAKERA